MNHRIRILTLSLGLILLGTGVPGAHAAVLKSAAELAAETFERLGKLWGRVPAKGAAEALEAAIKIQGEAAVRAAEHGGLALAETAARHGGEVFSFAAKVPEASAAIAAHAETLLPLARRFGDDILRIEARAPGLAADAAHFFGEKAGHLADLAKMERNTLQKTLIYAQHTPDAVTRAALLKLAKRNGESFLGHVSSEAARKGGLKMRHLVYAALAGAILSHSPNGVITVVGHILAGLFGWLFALLGWGIGMALFVWLACKLRLFSRIRAEWRRWKAAGRTAGSPDGSSI
jgi:hypothetical protein